MGLTLTEERNPLTKNIDTLPTFDMLSLINAEDQKVALAVVMNFPRLLLLWIASQLGCSVVDD